MAKSRDMLARAPVPSRFLGSFATEPLDSYLFIENGNNECGILPELLRVSAVTIRKDILTTGLIIEGPVRIWDSYRTNQRNEILLLDCASTPPSFHKDLGEDSILRYQDTAAIVLMPIDADKSSCREHADRFLSIRANVFMSSPSEFRDIRRIVQCPKLDTVHGVIYPVSATLTATGSETSDMSGIYGHNLALMFPSLHAPLVPEDVEVLNLLQRRGFFGSKTEDWFWKGCLLGMFGWVIFMMCIGTCFLQRRFIRDKLVVQKHQSKRVVEEVLETILDTRRKRAKERRERLEDEEFERRLQIADDKVDTVLKALDLNPKTMSVLSKIDRLTKDKISPGGPIPHAHLSSPGVIYPSDLGNIREDISQELAEEEEVQNVKAMAKLKDIQNETRDKLEAKNKFWESATGYFGPGESSVTGSHAQGQGAQPHHTSGLEGSPEEETRTGPTTEEKGKWVAGKRPKKVTLAVPPLDIGRHRRRTQDLQMTPVQLQASKDGHTPGIMLHHVKSPKKDTLPQRISQTQHQYLQPPPPSLRAPRARQPPGPVDKKENSGKKSSIGQKSDKDKETKKL